MLSIRANKDTEFARQSLLILEFLNILPYIRRVRLIYMLS